MTAGVPQGSLLGLLLWNTIYDELLRIPMSDCVKFIVFVADVSLVVTNKTTLQIKNVAEEVIYAIQSWMDHAGS